MVTLKQKLGQLAGKLSINVHNLVEYSMTDGSESEDALQQAALELHHQTQYHVSPELQNLGLQVQIPAPADTSNEDAAAHQQEQFLEQQQAGLPQPLAQAAQPSQLQQPQFQADVTAAWLQQQQQHQQQEAPQQHPQEAPQQFNLDDQPSSQSSELATALEQAQHFFNTSGHQLTPPPAGVTIEDWLIFSHQQWLQIQHAADQPVEQPVPPPERSARLAFGRVPTKPTRSASPYERPADNRNGPEVTYNDAWGTHTNDIDSDAPSFGARPAAAEVLHASDSGEGSADEAPQPRNSTSERNQRSTPRGSRTTIRNSSTTRREHLKQEQARSPSRTLLRKRGEILKKD